MHWFIEQYEVRPWHRHYLFSVEHRRVDRIRGRMMEHVRR